MEIIHHLQILMKGLLAKMLFDMRTDKLQSIDISNEPRYKEVVEKYSKKLLNMRKITNKPILIK